MNIRIIRFVTILVFFITAISADADMFLYQRSFNAMAKLLFHKKPCSPYTCMQYSSDKSKINVLNSWAPCNLFQGKDGYRKLAFMGENIAFSWIVIMGISALLNCNETTKGTKDVIFQEVYSRIDLCIYEICKKFLIVDLQALGYDD